MPSSSNKFFHDRTILILLGQLGLFSVFTTAVTLLRLGINRTDYTVQYRATSDFITGTKIELYYFVILFIAIPLFHAYLAHKVYHPRRFLSLVVLVMALILLVFGFFVINSLIEQNL